MSIINSLPEIKGSYRENSDLSKTNWFGVGGLAEILFRPHDLDDLIHFLKHKPRNINVTIIGVGSNLIIRDNGIKGVVIRLGRGFVENSVNGDILTVGAGALSYNVSMFALSHSLKNLEFLSGIPGTIGGNVAMNAGAYGNDIANIFIEAEAVDLDGNLYYLSNKDMGFVYRGNNVPSEFIFTKVKLKGEYGDAAFIRAKIDEIRIKREETQPIRSRTSGSTFANPTSYKAWELIDKAGCRGLKVGGAIISEKHCNFMINENNATAKDLETLGEIVKQKVKETSNIELEWEIKIIGEK